MLPGGVVICYGETINFFARGTGTHYEDLILSKMYTDIYVGIKTLR